MESLAKLEHKIADIFKGAPHLPSGIKKWLGENVWWIIAIVAAISIMAALSLLAVFFGSLSTLSSPFLSYYTSASYVARASLDAGVMLIFTIVQCILFVSAVRPLKDGQKKGWTLIFISMLLSALSIVVGALLTFNPFTFILNVVFGAFWLAVGLYFLFEIRDQFVRVEKSKGVKGTKK